MYGGIFMKKSIILSFVLLFSLISIGIVSAQDGRCTLHTGDEPPASEECVYFPLGVVSETECNNLEIWFDQIDSSTLTAWFLEADWNEDLADACTDVNVIPEFGTITAVMALIGAGGLFMFLRKGDEK